ncbi:MAG: HAMP domain-containing sensor histidine kinase [Candidatus Promineifilaceae bacterium]|nr:HAMP domain-containing histidine kinase [Anaerolineaceae bacterium]
MPFMTQIQHAIKKLLLISELEFSLQTNTAHILSAIRERIVTVLLRLCALLGLVSVSVGTWALWQDRNWAGILTGNLALGAVIYLAFRRPIDYRIRSTALVIIAYLYFFSSLVQGFTELTLAVLFAFVVMTTLLLGQKGGLFAFLISVVTLLFSSWALTLGLIQFAPAFPKLSEPLPKILVLYTDWAFFMGIFFFTIWTYFDGFGIAWERELEATTLLMQERDRLKQAVAREQALLEELSQAHQREIELSRMKSQIITTVSHEFRTPLTVISNSVELLTRYANKFDPTKQEAIHQRIDDSIAYLTELLQDASSVNQAYAQGFQANMAMLPFNGLAQRLKKELLQKCNDPAHVSFTYDGQLETAVSIDYDFVHRAALVFLNNALKYSPEANPITVSLLLADSQLTISVHDDGIGIPPNDLQQIWELFHRGRNATEKPGMGLGLYLAKRLVQAMGGTVTAVSPGLNQGSTFSLQIPQPGLQIVSTS